MALALVAAVLGARAAALLDAPPQRLTRAVESNGRVARRDAAGARERLQALALELDATDRLGVIGAQRVHEAPHAGADHLGELGVAHVAAARLTAQGGQPAALGVGVAMVVDDGIAQDSVEPGQRRLVVAQRAAARQAAHERLLQDLLGRVARAHAPLEEGQEAGVVLDEDAQHGR